MCLRVGGKLLLDVELGAWDGRGGSNNTVKRSGDLRTEKHGGTGLEQVTLEADVSADDKKYPILCHRCHLSKIMALQLLKSF